MLIFLGFVASVVTFSSEQEQEDDLVMRNFKKVPRRGKWLLAARYDSPAAAKQVL